MISATELKGDKTEGKDGGGDAKSCSGSQPYLKNSHLSPHLQKTLRHLRRSCRRSTSGWNATHLFASREMHSDTTSTTFQRSLQVTSEFVKRLGLKQELKGHTGCVNCLEWSHSGDLLASGSDDVTVILWDPHEGRKLARIRTGHHGNIFSVKFLPESSDNILVTGAADYRIRVHDLNVATPATDGDASRLSNALSQDPPPPLPDGASPGGSTHVFACHAGRVKRIATAPGLPFVFWSGAEDGMVMEFDLRTPELCNPSNPRNVLINLNHHLGLNAEVKCLSVNPLRPHILAVGANDPFVRVFDRRMLTCSSVKFPHGGSSNPGDSETGSQSQAPWDQRHALLAHLLSEEGDTLKPESAQYYVAGHLPIKQQDYRRRYRTLASTYVTFSPDGTELLANLGGEQIYLFDLHQSERPKRFDLSALTTSLGQRKGTNGFHSLYRNGQIKSKLLESLNSTSPQEALTAAASAAKSKKFLKKTESEGSSSGSSSESSSEDESENEESAGTNVKRSRLTLCDSGHDATHMAPYQGQERAAVPLAPRAELLKEKGNQAFNRQHYSLAISLYNEALAASPASHTLYANRAAALMKRGWDGDLYAALRDCHTALRGEGLASVKCKAHFRLAKCLYELHWTREALECLTHFKRDFPDAVKQPCETLERDIKAAIIARTDRVTEDEDDDKETDGTQRKKSRSKRSRSPSACSRLSDKEKNWRANSKDYKMRFAGHCNTTTDIKEANFFGSNGQFVVAGSDDGSFFIWDRNTTNISRVLRGDDSIVNCLQPHPSTCLLASSGIDPVVRLWAPRPDDGVKDEREVSDSDDAAIANQKRMNADPLEVMLMNMGYRISGTMAGDEDDEEEEEGESPSDRPQVACPTS